MRRFTIAHDYKAYRDGKTLGPWKAGEVVELSEEDQRFVERDSPGALVDLGENKGERVDDPTHTPAGPREDDEAQRRARPVADRQRRGGADRSATTEG